MSNRKSLSEESEILEAKLMKASKDGDFEEFEKLRREYDFLSSRKAFEYNDFSSATSRRELKTYSKVPQINNNKPMMRK